MTMKRLAYRRWTDRIARAMAALAAVFGVVVLGAILLTVVYRGASALGIDFFTLATAAPRERGGMANALLGTFYLVVLATLLGVPLGMLCGTYLAEFGREGPLAVAVRFACEILMGTPSILIGVLIYTLLVVPVGGFSGYAGAVALAVIMIPVVARTTDEMLRLVPHELRESALALGAPHWKVTLGVVFTAARSGLVTGALLALARTSGETAPLLFTALNSTAWPRDLTEPTANLTVTIYNRAMSPFDDWQQMAWGASLVITSAVLGLTVAARWALGRHCR